METLPVSSRCVQTMEKICFVLNILPEHMDEYKNRHADVWPDMQEALSKSGWTNYSLFLRDDGLAIGYFECENYEEALSNMENFEVNERWQATMLPLVAGVPSGKRADQTLERVPLIFNLD